MEFIIEDDTHMILIEIQLLVTKFEEMYGYNKLLTSKKTKKQECSNYVWNNISSREKLIKTTIFKKNNEIYINYPIIKWFVIPEIYDSIVEYIVVLVTSILQTGGTYNIHINIEGFTISAAERYSDLISVVFMKLFNETYINPLEKMYIYNTPSVIDFLSSMFRKFMRGNTFLDEKVVMLSNTTL